MSTSGWPLDPFGRYVSDTDEILPPHNRLIDNRGRAEADAAVHDAMPNRPDAGERVHLLEQSDGGAKGLAVVLRRRVPLEPASTGGQ